MDLKNPDLPITNFSESGVSKNEIKETPVPKFSSRRTLADILGIKSQPKVKFKPVRLLNKNLSEILQDSDNESDIESDKQISDLKEEKNCRDSQLIVSEEHDSKLNSREETEKNEFISNVKTQCLQVSDSEISEHSLPTGISWLDTTNSQKKPNNQMGIFPLRSVKNTPKEHTVNTLNKNENTKIPSCANLHKQSMINSCSKPTPLKGSILDNILEDSDPLSVKIPSCSIIGRQQWLKHYKQSAPQSETKYNKVYTTPYKNDNVVNCSSFKSTEIFKGSISNQNKYSSTKNVNELNTEQKNIIKKLNHDNISVDTKNINRPLFDDTNSKSEQNIEHDMNKLSLSNVNTNTSPTVLTEQKNNVVQSVITDSDLKPLVSNSQVQILKHDTQDLWINSILDEKNKDDGLINIIPSFSLSKNCILKCRSIFIKGQGYSVLNKVGNGGSCEVYQIFDSKNSQLKAVKVVNLAVDQITAQGYINEVKLLLKLQGNDCVIKMYDYEILQEQKLLLVVMERGEIDLAKLLRNTATSRSHLPLHTIIGYWTEMLEAVKYIHNNGIIHSDLKPGNFLLVMGHLKLIDFGIASVLEDNMTSVIKSTQVGTFNYISPEALIDSQINNPGSPLKKIPRIKISYKSDVWSLGCILYNLVYRRTPFEHITKSWMKMEAITDPTYQINYPKVPHCSEIIIDTMKKCLTYEINKRPTVNELLSIKYR